MTSFRIADRVNPSRYERSKIFILSSAERTRDQQDTSFEVVKESWGEFSLTVAVVAVVVAAPLSSSSSSSPASHRDNAIMRIRAICIFQKALHRKA